MSIIWIPQPKVIGGKEETYDTLTERILDIFQADEVVVDDSSDNPEVQQLVKQLSAISITPYQTLNIPVIGQDQAANAYFLQKFKKVYPKQFDPQKVIEKVSGHHAIGMAQDTDGISVYRPENEEVYVFDATLMVDCLPFVGPGILLSSAFDKTADKAIDFGNRIKAVADPLIHKHKLEYLRDIKEKPVDGTKEGHKLIHFMLAASSWLIFWGTHGHGIGTQSI